MNPLPTHIDQYPLRYFGAKKRFLGDILPLIPKGTKTLLEPFGGTGVVSWAAKQSGMRVVVNDVLLAAHLRHRALVANDGTLLNEDDMKLLTENPAKSGPFHERYLATLGERNADFLDGMVSAIPGLVNQLKQDIATVLPCLIAMQKLKFNAYRFTASGSLTGFQHLQAVDMKQEFLDFATNLLPLLVNDNGLVNEAHQMDAIALMGQTEAGCAYIDTPYASARGGEYESIHAIWDDWCRYLQGRGNEVQNSYDEKADLPPYTRFERRRPAIQGFFSIFDAAQHIPTVILSYNTTSGIAPEELMGIARCFKRNVSITRRKSRLPKTVKGRDAYTEEVLITATAPAMARTPRISPVVSLRGSLRQQADMVSSSAMIESETAMLADAQSNSGTRRRRCI